MSWRHQIPKHKHETHLLNNLGSKDSLAMKFGQFVILQNKIFYQKFCEKCGLETSLNLVESSRNFFNFQRILCKKESEEVSILIWTNFDSFAIIYLI